MPEDPTEGAPGATGKLLEQVVSRLRDQRFLFLVAVIIALAVLAPLKVISASTVIIIFGISAGVVLVDRVLEFVGARSGRNGSAVGGLAMSIALDFEGLAEGTPIRLVRGVCTIQNPRDPQQLATREVVPYPQGFGWLCPIPLEAGPDDVVNITLTDDNGIRWNVVLVPRLLWPRVKAQRLP